MGAGIPTLSIGKLNRPAKVALQTISALHGGALLDFTIEVYSGGVRRL
jgi:hypothetical protein